MNKKTALVLALLAGSAALPARADAPVTRAVIVMRHGVRPPTKPNSAIQPFARDAWPAWPVAPGELTPHGAAATAAFGRALGVWLRGAHLLPETGCPAATDLFVYADGADQRTRATAAALLGAIAPGCGLAARNAGEGKEDPVFSPAETGACAYEAAPERAALQDAFGAGGLDAPFPGYKDSLAALAAVLNPPDSGGACKGDSKLCFETTPNTIETTDEGLRIKGPLATGASLGEDLALEYFEGMSGHDLGWGRLTPQSLAQIMQLHTAYSRMLRENPYLAARNGALLGRAIGQALDGAPALAGAPAARVTIFVGHDTNVANLAGLFGLHWSLQDQEVRTPPDGALVFTRDGAGISARFAYQNAEELRAAAAPSHMPGVALGAVDVGAALQRVPAACVLPSH